MNYIKPKLFSVMKDYTKEQFVKDVVAGIIVAIIALPLSIALSLASGVTPEMGLYTAIVAGFIISFFGGSRVQIAGPTAAFATIVAGIVATEGIDGLIIATIMAGIILVLMGLFKFGSLIKFIPLTITTGFTSGIAVTIFIGQIKDFLGLTFKPTKEPLIETMDKVKMIGRCINTVNVSALIIGLVALLILIVWPKVNKIIPPSLIAIIVTAAAVKLLSLDVNTIGSLYTISSKLPHFNMPAFTFAKVRLLLPNAFTIAILAAIESLLSCVVADGMIGSKHKSNAELVAQGLGNIGSAFFGGIPATGAIARTAANVKNGGRTPIAGIVHSITLALILVILMPYAALIPMPCIAAILFMVAYNMSEWRKFLNICKTAPKSDILVLVLTFVLTVVFDLVVAIGVGIVLTCLLFMKRMSEVTDVHGWKYIDEDEEDTEDEDAIGLKIVPKGTHVFEINGPMFFGAADKFMEVVSETEGDVLIIRMRGVPALDVTAYQTLLNILKTCKANGMTLVLSHINEQPMHVFEKAGFIEMVGEENICPNIDAAIERANEIHSKNGG
ncbi:MAG: SulP family inorganic anion transporter [Lachnospiraceae bacterium]|nr:SulP family inorganic anion transporter [Clostridiales bacterium]MDD6293788.1 SulP family inorganic anion transporter [Eubacteriales bacterium]MDY2608439.1 SulP family inorganic anion transporter [Lachnospiraceae bacterium]